MMAMGSTRTVAEEFIRNWVVSSIRKVMAPSRMMGGRLLSTGLMALTRYSAAPLLTRALLRGKIPPTMKMVEVGEGLDGFLQADAAGDDDEDRADDAGNVHGDDAGSHSNQNTDEDHSDQNHLFWCRTLPCGHRP